MVYTCFDPLLAKGLLRSLPSLMFFGYVPLMNPTDVAHPRPFQPSGLVPVYTNLDKFSVIKLGRYRDLAIGVILVDIGDGNISIHSYSPHHSH